MLFQEEIVKLQVLNLAVKLYLTNREQTELLVEYVFNLARLALKHYLIVLLWFS